MGVRVPRITIQADYGDSAAFGELSIISVGYGLQQAWIYSAMFDTGSTFGVTPLFGADLAAHFSYFVSLVVFCIVLLVASAFDQKLIKPLHARPVLAASAALCSLGSLLLFLPESTTLNPAIIEAFSGMFTGIGSAVLLLAWGVAFAWRDASSIAINGALAITIGVAIYACVLAQLPFPVSGIVVAGIPLLELAILFSVQRESVETDPDIAYFAPLPINRGEFAWRFGLPVLLFGLALGIIRQTSVLEIMAITSFNDQVVVCAAACCATLLILVTFLALGGNRRWDIFFRPLVPIVTIAIAAAGFIGNTDSMLPSGLLLAGYMTFEALMWIFFGQLAQRFRLSPIFVFGLGRGVMASAMLIGSITLAAEPEIVLHSPLGSSTLALILIVLIMTGYVLMPSEREVAGVVTFDPERAKAVKNICRVQAAATENNDAPIERSADQVGITCARTQAERAGMSADEIERACSACSNTQHVGTAPNEGETPAKPDMETENASAFIGNAAATDRHADATTTANHAAAQFVPIADDTAHAVTTNTAQTAWNAPRSGAFDEDAIADIVDAESNLAKRCENIANTYLLSKRETEVMFLLARGFNSSYIQEKLYISEGTAKTHIRHIYRKVNVHSQQELMRLVEAVDL